MSGRATARLPDDLMRRAKAKAATLSALIEEGLRRVVSERPPPFRTWTIAGGRLDPRGV